MFSLHSYHYRSFITTKNNLCFFLSFLFFMVRLNNIICFLNSYWSTYMIEIFMDIEILSEIFPKQNNHCNDSRKNRDRNMALIKEAYTEFCSCWIGSSILYNGWVNDESFASIFFNFILFIIIIIINDLDAQTKEMKCNQSTLDDRKNKIRLR